MRLLLVRHGQTTSNVSGVMDTAAPGPELTDLGRRQAEAVPGALAHEDVAAIYCSRLVRTQRTAAPLATRLGLAPTVVEGLEEISAGDLETSTDHADHARYHQVMHAWFAGDLDAALPGAPDGHAFLERYDAALAEVARLHGANPGAAVVFTHAAAIRAFLVLRLGTSDRPIDNTGAAVLEGDGRSRWDLLAWSGEPLGGPTLRSPVTAHDVAGDPARR